MKADNGIGVFANDWDSNLTRENRIVLKISIVACMNREQAWGLSMANIDQMEAVLVTFFLTSPKPVITAVVRVLSVLKPCYSGSEYLSTLTKLFVFPWQ